MKDKSGKDIDVSSWAQEFVKDLPEQFNGFVLSSPFEFIFLSPRLLFEFKIIIIIIIIIMKQV